MTRAGVSELDFPDWEELYRTQPVDTLPWYTAELDPDILGALEGVSRSRLLEIGTGPGTQAIALARAGFSVTATDLAGSAVAKAQTRARAENVRAVFLQDDILHTALPGPFDVLVDRGCFEVIAPEARPTYVRAVGQLLAPGGLFLLKCFSQRDSSADAPYKFTEAQLRELFGEGFDEIRVRETVYPGTVKPLPIALFGLMRRHRQP
jgi:2-polyprenyl-3-methyl-5-hydroxy-6-metoxy-1,4-benzoquinol methylase